MNIIKGLHSKQSTQKGYSVSTEKEKEKKPSQFTLSGSDDIDGSGGSGAEVLSSYISAKRISHHRKENLLRRTILKDILFKSHQKGIHEEEGYYCSKVPEEELDNRSLYFRYHQ